MPRNESASAIWERLDGIKQPLMTRVENYAALTIPSVCLPLGFDQVSMDQTHDYQSIGAQSVNNVVNKAMIALFAPSRPFFKANTGPKSSRKLQEANIPDNTIQTGLASIERQAVSKLDELGQRPKLYQTLRHLVISGNALLCLDEDELRMIGLRYYNVKRTQSGKVHTLVIREKVKFDELDPKVQKVVLGHTADDSVVSHFKLIQLLPSGNYLMTQWVDGQKLPMEFNGKWKPERMPYQVLAWNLADEADYGTGLVEEYAGDLEAASVLSEATVNGGILAAEFRWLVSPTGQTSIDDLNNSKNGDAVAGKPDDIQPTQGGNPQAINELAQVLDRYEKRIARGFLVNQQREAERVTAEEVRLTAQELETSFGGVYSTLAVTLQRPVAWWLLGMVDPSALKSDIQLTIVTGLDALSRNGDLENLRLAIQDLAGLTAVPPQLQQRINWDTISAFVGQGRGVDLTKFLLSQDQVDANTQKALAQQTQAANAQAAGAAAANADPTPNNGA